MVYMNIVQFISNCCANKFLFTAPGKKYRNLQIVIIFIVKLGKNVTLADANVSSHVH